MKPTRRGILKPTFIVAFVGAFLGLSGVADKGPMFVGLSLRSGDTPGSVTGTVTEWHAGKTIAVGRRQNPKGFAMALRPNTLYEGEISTIKPGVRVTVWYRNVSERRLVAEKVRVLDH